MGGYSLGRRTRSSDVKWSMRPINESPRQKSGMIQEKAPLNKVALAHLRIDVNAHVATCSLLSHADPDLPAKENGR